MAMCGHRFSNYEMIDGREYAICQECGWMCNGHIGRLSAR